MPAPRHRREELADLVRRTAREVRDRLAVSDPGLGRLRQGLSASVCVATAVPVQLGVGRLLGYAGQLGFTTALFGAVVAMLGATSLAGQSRRATVRTGVFFPLAAAVGVVPATLLDGRRLGQVVGFAVVLFAAVWVRRFGPAWLTFGFIGWMGFFFATFLQATPALVPELLVAAVVSTAWVLLLTTTVLRTDPRVVLHSVLSAFFTRGRMAAGAAADLLAATTPRTTARAHAAASGALAGLAETALLTEAWSAEPGAVPEGWSASALRRRTIETQQAAERFTGAAESLADDAHAEPALRDEARRALGHLAHRRDRAASAAAARLLEVATEDAGSGWWPARQVAVGVREFVRLDAGADDPPDVDPGEEEFEAATGLVLGNLPGAPAVARDVTSRGSRFNPFAHARMSTRQAAQVVVAGLVAIALGTLLSPTRYYWAVLAAYVTFAGTGTRSETFLRGVARIAGTLVGLVAAIALAHVTGGHTSAVFATIVVAIFFAFYLNKVSFAATTFFITVLLGQLYTVLGTFSDSLLALRLGETAVGAVAGVVVALVFAPLSTRDTVRSARDAVLDALADLLEGVAAHARGDRVDLDGATRRLDDAARRLALVAKPLTKPLVLGNSSRSTRRRLGLVVAAVSQSRALTLAAQVRPLTDPGATATAACALADAARELGAVQVGQAAPRAEVPLQLSDRALFGTGLDSREPDPVARHLHHLSGTLTQLAEAPLAAREPHPHGLLHRLTPQARSATGPHPPG